MIIYPAIDIKDGNCVRLIQGLKDQVTVYGNQPKDVAQSWQEQGAQFLHVVDLDGAFDGISPNRDVILDLLSGINLPVQIGGGIRTMETIDFYLSQPNVQRVILGTSAIKDQELLKQALQRYGERIVVGLDAKDGCVAINGWVEKTDLEVIAFAKYLEQLGVRTIIYTDISKDGMLTGPNLTMTKRLAEETTLEVIASGGVGDLSHLVGVQSTGAKGVIVGKALYEQRVTLSEALAIGGVANAH